MSSFLVFAVYSLDAKLLWQGNWREIERVRKRGSWPFYQRFMLMYTIAFMVVFGAVAWVFKEMSVDMLVATWWGAGEMEIVRGRGRRCRYWSRGRQVRLGLKMIKNLSVGRKEIRHGDLVCCRSHRGTWSLFFSLSFHENALLTSTFSIKSVDMSVDQMRSERGGRKALNWNGAECGRKREYDVNVVILFPKKD